MSTGSAASAKVVVVAVTVSEAHHRNIVLKIHIIVRHVVCGT